MVQNKRSRLILDATYIRRVLSWNITFGCSYFVRVLSKTWTSSYKWFRVLNKTWTISAHACHMRDDNNKSSFCWPVTQANKMAFQSIAFFRLVSDFCCILRMQRQVSEFSLTARSSQQKRTSQSGKNIFEEVSSFLKWRHAFVFCYSAPFWILLTALLMATSHVNEAVSNIRRKPFMREVRFLCKTRTYKWYSSRLM